MPRKTHALKHIQKTDTADAGEATHSSWDHACSCATQASLSLLIISCLRWCRTCRTRNHNIYWRTTAPGLCQRTLGIFWTERMNEGRIQWSSHSGRPLTTSLRFDNKAGNKPCLSSCGTPWYTLVIHKNLPTECSHCVRFKLTSVL